MEDPRDGHSNEGRYPSETRSSPNSNKQPVQSNRTASRGNNRRYFFIHLKFVLMSSFELFIGKRGRGSQYRYPNTEQYSPNSGERVNFLF